MPRIAGGQRRLELDISGLLAIEKEQRAVFDPESMSRAVGSWLDFEEGVLVDSDNTAIGKLQGCAAVSGGPEAITGMKQLIGVRRTPVIGVGGGDLDRPGKCDELTG